MDVYTVHNTHTYRYTTCREHAREHSVPTVHTLSLYTARLASVTHRTIRLHNLFQCFKQ